MNLTHMSTFTDIAWKISDVPCLGSVPKVPWNVTVEHRDALSGQMDSTKDRRVESLVSQLIWMGPVHIGPTSDDAHVNIWPTV